MDLRITELFENPQITELRKNPKITELFNNPKITELFNNPQITELFKNHKCVIIKKNKFIWCGNEQCIKKPNFFTRIHNLLYDESYLKTPYIINIRTQIDNILAEYKHICGTIYIGTDLNYKIRWCGDPSVCWELLKYPPLYELVRNKKHPCIRILNKGPPVKYVYCKKDNCLISDLGHNHHCVIIDRSTNEIRWCGRNVCKDMNAINDI